MSEMKSILESFKRFELSVSSETHSPVILFENNQKKEVDFITLIERKDLSDQHLSNILTESFDYEYNALLEEGILNNISNFVSNTMNKAKTLIQRGKIQGLILLNKLKDSALKFQKEHPKVSKAIVILVTAAAAYFLIEFLAGSQAHAAITDIPLETLQVLTGATDQLVTAAAEAGNMDAAQALEVAVQGLKKGHQLESEMQFSKLMDALPSNSQEQLRKAIDFVSKLSSEARADGAGSEAEAMLKSARAIGELILKSK